MIRKKLLTVLSLLLKCFCLTQAQEKKLQGLGIIWIR